MLNLIKFYFRMIKCIIGKMNKNYAVINNQDSNEIENKIKEI